MRLRDTLGNSSGFMPDPPSAKENGRSDCGCLCKAYAAIVARTELKYKPLPRSQLDQLQSSGQPVAGSNGGRKRTSRIKSTEWLLARLPASGPLPRFGNSVRC
jgi:hypothetical protein